MKATITAKLLHSRRYASNVTFPKIFFGDVATQCRNFDSVGQKMVVVAHNKAAIWSALFDRGIGASVKPMDIPYHFEVTATKKNMTPAEAKALRSLQNKAYRLKTAK